MKTIKYKRLTIELETLKTDDGRLIALPAAIIAIDTESKDFGISIAILWYSFSITYYYGKNLDC